MTKSVQKIIDKTYQPGFTYIEKVINSCRTHAQLGVASDWAYRIYRQFWNNTDDFSIGECLSIKKYLDRKIAEIREIVNRKDDELDVKFGYKNVED